MFKNAVRFLSLILCAALLFSPCAVSASADGETDQAACDHDFQIIPEGRSWITHVEECVKCHARKNVPCVESTHLQRRGSCLNTWYCACGNAARDAFSEHNFTAWVTDGSTHTRRCTNPGCEVVESGSHDFVPSTDCTVPVYCSVCGLPNGTTLFSEHAWSAWTDTGSGTHYRRCTHGGCTVRETAAHVPTTAEDDIVCAECGAVIDEGAAEHTWSQWTSTGDGGHVRHCLDAGCSVAQSTNHHIGTDASCVSPAVCADCGAYYGSKDPGRHTGGTEVRDSVSAGPGTDGYTGDTYCLGCGQLLKRGETIPAQEEDHVHGFDSFNHDSVRHWHECLCGAKEDEEAHTFEDGRCVVCGVEDPSFKPHTHTYGEEYGSDQYEHWVSCVECGARQTEAHSVGEWTQGLLGHTGVCSVCGSTASGLHTYQNGSCTVCGAKDPDAGSGGGTYTIRADTEIIDVTPDTPYADSIQKMLDLKLMVGVSEDSFAPEASFTRSQLVVLMYRIAGNPETRAENPFTDVAEGVWYSDAAAWAAEQKVVSGIGDDRFDPDGLINAQMMAKVLYNYAERLGLSTEVSADALSGITDLDEVDPWARTAVNWAVSAGILVPENGKLHPTSTIDRATVARIMDLFLVSAQGKKS